MKELEEPSLLVEGLTSYPKALAALNEFARLVTSTIQDVVEQELPSLPAPDNLKRDGAAGKNARARSTYPARLAGSLAAGRPAPPIGTKRRPLLLCGNSPAHGTARTKLKRRYPFLPQTPNPNGLALSVLLRPLQQSLRNTRPSTPKETINSS